MVKWVWIYVAAFVTLTATDIATTVWGISSQNGHEFNSAVATADGGLHLQQMLVLNGAFLIFSAGMLVWALRHRDKVNPRYLERPERALFSWVHVNPFAKRTMPKSVFSYIALAPGILGFKAFASVNNALIASGLPDMATPIARAVDRFADGQATYWIVIFILFMPIWWACVHLTARFLRGQGPARAPALAR